MNTFTQLEDDLRNDHSGNTRRTLLAQLNEAARAMEKQLRQPIDSDLFASVERKHRACLAAIQIIETIWSCHHAQRN